MGPIRETFHIDIAISGDCEPGSGPVADLLYWPALGRRTSPTSPSTWCCPHRSGVAALDEPVTSHQPCERLLTRTIMSLAGTDAGQVGDIMFMQVISGMITDATAAQALLERWQTDLAPGAEGWLSSTSGATADGEYVVFACFESRQAARRNSDRPEQGAWWAEVERCFAQPPVFADYDDALILRGGVSPGAGFVQAMLGTVSDVERERELSRAFVTADTDMRPDLLGGIIGIGDDGRFAQAMYFSSEADARAGEQADVPPEMAEGFAEEQQIITEIRYLDLTAPDIVTAG